MSVNASTGAFVPLDDMGGPVAIHITNNTGQPIDIVFGVADATAAAGTGAGQRYILASGTTPATMITNFRCTPNQTWLRCNSTTAVTNLGVILAW
jgi:hypothetical protein